MQAFDLPDGIAVILWPIAAGGTMTRVHHRQCTSHIGSKRLTDSLDPVCQIVGLAAPVCRRMQMRSRARELTQQGKDIGRGRVPLTKR